VFLLSGKDNNIRHIIKNEKTVAVVRHPYQLGCRAVVPRQPRKIQSTLKTNNLSDSKRQQTITVDYKRLINGLVLADGFSLQRKQL
jgi:hypothetical protein